jgi:transposase-like protein
MQHFHLFLKECEWRFNYRPVSRMLQHLTRCWFNQSYP